MKYLVFLITFTFLQGPLFAQDTVYCSLNKYWGGSILLKSGKKYLVQSFYPDGKLKMKGSLKDFTYEFPERIYGRGSTAYSYTTGRILKKTIKVPDEKLVLYYNNGTIFQQYEKNVLNIYDVFGNDSCIYYFSKRNKIDSSVFYYGNGEVKQKTDGNEPTLVNLTVSVTYVGGAFLRINYYIPSRKRSFYPTGELECNWTYVHKKPAHLSFYQREFYTKSGEKNTKLIQTNDNKLTGELRSYYHSGRLKSVETLYRDKRNGGYRLYAENGQLVEQSSQIGRKTDSVKVVWFENGQMKKWGDDDQYYTWYKNGVLRKEHGGGRFGLNFEYDIKGNIIRSNYFNMAYFKADSTFVRSHGERDSSGLRHGLWNGYFFDSTLAYQASFVHGKQDGEFIVYQMNGKRKYLRNYDLAVLHGKYINYGINGEKLTEGYYEKGRRKGDWIDYRLNGSLYKWTHYPTFGRLIVMKQYVTDSSANILSTIDSTENTIETVHYQNGQIHRRKIYSFDGLQLLGQHYHNNGQLKHSEERFYSARKQPVPYTHHLPIYDSVGNIVKYKDSVGHRIPRTEVKYFRNGTMEMESIYGFKGKDNVLKTYHSNGKLKSHSISPPDKFRRTSNTTKYYDNKGELIKKEIFLNGELVKTKERGVKW